MASSVDGAAALLERLRSFEKDPVLQRLRPKGIPLLYGDEDFELGESDVHLRTCNILLYGLESHLTGRTQYRVFSNLNLAYSETDPQAYVSPDLMVVRPARRLPRNIATYHIGREGPAPVLVAEVLSFRTYQQGDLTDKPVLYAGLGIEEYLLADVTGELLPRRLLLLRRRPDAFWREDQDPDGGVTSRLGFRVVLERDGQVRVSDAKTGTPYARPDEAQEMAAKVQALEEELARLRGATPKQTKAKRRRRKS
jgi:Uma2 family endonuclease